MPASSFASLGVQVTTRRLTTAELETLGDTPVELVPGVPGAILMGVSVVGQTAPGTTPFGSAPTFTLVGGATGSASLVGLSLSSGTAGFISAVLGGTDGGTAFAAGTPLSISASANPTFSGGILTSSLDTAGGGYVPGDTGTVDAGDGNATYVVDTVANAYAVVGVSQGTKTFTLQGDRTANFAPADVLFVLRSTGNDGSYTVGSVTLNGSNTDIVVVEAIPSAVADGYAGNDAGAIGSLATYTITDRGTGYVPGGPSDLIATTGVGTVGAITVDTVTSTVDMEATFTVAYYVVPVA